MGNTTRAAFSPAPYGTPNTIDCIAGEAILAGDVVAIAGTGVDWTVWLQVQGTTEAPVGVAMASVSAGQHVAVASVGSMVKVKEGDGGGLDAGDQLIGYVTVPGTVNLDASAAAEWVIGYMLTDAAANATGYAMINPVFLGKGK